MKARFMELTAAYLDGTLAADERSELRTFLRDDAGLLTEFAGQLRLHKEIVFFLAETAERTNVAAERILHGLEASLSGADFGKRTMGRMRKAGAQSDSGRNARRKVLRFIRPLAALAAAALVVLGVWQWSERDSSARLPGRALVQVQTVSGPVVRVSASGRTWLASGAELRAGDRIETDVGGGVALRWLDRSALVELGERSVFRMGDRSDAHGLEAGSLAATVFARDPARPFATVTPHARATVAGTRYRVTVRPDGGTGFQNESLFFASDTGFTRLDVEEGLVRILCLADGAVADVPSGSSAMATASLDVFHTIYRDAFDGSALADFWEPPERADQVAPGDGDLGSALVLSVAGPEADARHGGPFADEIRLLSRSLDASSGVLDVRVVYRNPINRVGQQARNRETAVPLSAVQVGLTDSAGRPLDVELLAERIALARPAQRATLVHLDERAVTASRLIIMPDGRAMILTDTDATLARMGKPPAGVRIILSLRANDPAVYSRWPIEQVEARRWTAVPSDIRALLDKMKETEN